MFQQCALLLFCRSESSCKFRATLKHIRKIINKNTSNLKQNLHEEHLLPNEPESLARHSHGAVPKLSRFSAKITVSGVVYDAEGEPAIGATVALEGQPTAGVTTDFDGNYESR